MLCHMSDPEIEDHDKGLAFDLPKLITRRRALGLFAGGLATTALAACGAPRSPRARPRPPVRSPRRRAARSRATAPTGPTSLDRERRRAQRHHEELRRRVRRGRGRADHGRADAARRRRGRSAAGRRRRLPWHCTAGGQYSLYDQDVAGENYLRGVQESDADGKLTFKTIFPAAYSGRWPHIHFEVYASLDAATSAGSKLRTSQLALPKEACELVYATAGYEQSVENLAQTSLDSDMVFSDGYASQLATTTGTVESGIDGQAQRRRLSAQARPPRAVRWSGRRGAASPVPRRPSRTPRRSRRHRP